MPALGPRWAARESLLRLGATRLYVRDIGAGLPMIVVHGGPDFDHEYLLPGLDRLAGLCHLVYYDQRGRGRSFSGEGPDDITLGSEMDDLDAVRAWTGSDAVAVLGHSWGGLLALEYALRHPDRVSHLVLMNTAPVSHSDMLEFRRSLVMRRSPEQAQRMAALAVDPTYLSGDIDADAEYHRIHFSTAFRRVEELEPTVRRLRRGFTPEGIVAARAIEARLYRSTWDAEDYDLLAGLRELRIPGLVLHGDTDIVPLGVARRIADAIPGCRFVLLADSGHFAFVDQPGRVAEAIKELLAGSESSGRGPTGP